MSAIQVPSPPVACSSQGDMIATPYSAKCENPGNQTLAELKQEAAQTKYKGSKKLTQKGKAKNPRKEDPARSLETKSKMGWLGPERLCPVQWTQGGSLTNFIDKFVRGTSQFMVGAIKK